MADEFKSYLEKRQVAREQLIRLMGMRLRQHDGEVKRLRAKADVLIDDWWFHHSDLPRTPENERRAISEVMDFMFQQNAGEEPSGLDKF